MEKKMSIAPTRRVGSSVSASRADKSYAAARLNTQFVEMIDTNNNVLVRDETNEHHSQESFFQEKNDTSSQKPVSADAPYVASSIEALAVSGVFEEEANKNDSQSNHKVGVYDNNQSIIRDEELERTGRNYLKHFYEKNEHIADVDEFV